MIKSNNKPTRKHYGKHSKHNLNINLYPYRDWIQDEKQRRLQGKRGRRLHDKQFKMSPFSPENFPLSIKYLVFDYDNSCTTERKIYSPQQFVLPTILYYLYLYFILLIMVTSSHLTTGGTFQVPWLLTPSGCQLGCGLSFLCMSQIKVAYFYLVSFVILRLVNKKTQKFSKKLLKLKFCLYKNPSRFSRLASSMTLGLLTLNFLLIGICNPSLLNPGPQSIKVCYQNVRGLIPYSQLDSPHPNLDRAKIFELNAYMHSAKPDIVILNETWLKKSIKNNEVIENLNYNVYRNDRSQLTHPADPSNPKKFRKNGGGVLIAVRSDISASINRLSMRKGAEILAIELDIGGNKYVFCTVYRVGTLGENNHDSIINSIKTFYGGRNHKKVVIIGDFNLSTALWPTTEDNINVCNHLDTLFVNSFEDLGLHQCIDVPTHCKGKTLDLLLTNTESLVSNVRVSEQFTICKSDHFPISFDVKANVKFKKPLKRKVYNFKRANWEQLNGDLRNVPWNSLIDRTEPELAWRMFKSTLFKLVDKNIPKITLKGNFDSPWFDAECYDSYRCKERAHKKFKKDVNLTNELRRDRTRQNFKNICSTKMRDNLYNSDDPALITKKFWSHVKSHSKSNRIPECIHLNSCYRNQPAEKAELFNNFFCDQFSEASEYGVDVDWSNDFSFEIDFCHRNIRKLLSNINSNKACGPDGIHGKILKYCAVSLAYPLSLMFKISYNTGCIPRDWKLAHVVPVHKKGSKNNVENYRPISLTSLVMKTYERILKEELLIRTSHLLDNRQHGFLRLKSCSTNMVTFTDSVVLSINDCKTLSSDVVYFDFSKAFDSVNHDLILFKLKYYFKIEGRLLKLLENYLCGREQCVVIDGCKSSNKPVLSGVPQGSILGPILFVLFINDLPSGLSEGTNIALYADDTKIWRPITCENDHRILQTDIDYLNEWATQNKMKFHPKKCKVVSICNRPSPLWMLPFIVFNYSLGQSILQYADCEKDLGVHVNPKFNFNAHCEHLISKASQQFGMVRRTCHFVKDVKRRRVLYLTLVRSQFEHCSPVWRPNGKSMIERLDNFQKKCIKWILSEEELSYESHDAYVRKCRQVNILPLSHRFILNDILLFHKVVNKIVPIDIPNYLTLFTGQSRLRSSHRDELSFVCSLLPNSSNTNLLEKSFFYRTHMVWNSMPLEIRKLESTSEFKAKIETHLWDMLLNIEDGERGGIG